MKLKYAPNTNTGYFYDLLCSYSFRPLILQPTRVTSTTATLIDNIFINNMADHSDGGNLTSSISDNFFQFCQTDICQTPGNKRSSKIARDFKTFNKREFGEEMSNIDWSDVISETFGTDWSYHRFYRKIENILDHMAPYCKMTQKELKREQMPWITRGILVAMGRRDMLKKCWSGEKDSQFKNRILALYKRYRNMILTLLRRSKINYYSFFKQSQSNVKKTWDGIRYLINVAK